MKQATILIALLFSIVVTANPQEAVETEKLLLTNVRIFDVTTGTFTKPQNIYIDGGTIYHVGIIWDAPFDGREIDCRGKFAVPGLFDCHVHLTHLTDSGRDSLAIALKDFVARGVMHVRDVGGPIDVVSDLNHKISSGEFIGPEMFYTGPMLEKSPLTWGDVNETYPNFTVAINSVEDVDSVLPSLAAKGACLVKTFSKMDTAVYHHLAEVAAEHSLKIVHDPGGPLFHSIPMDWATDLGVTSIEHAKAPWPVVLNDSLAEEYDRLMAAPPDPMTSRAFMSKVAGMGVESVSLEKLGQLAEKMKQHGVYLCPTLHVLESMEEMAIESSKEAMQVEQLPEPMLAMIKKGVAGMAAVSRLFVTELSKDSVKMLVGQDGIDPAATFTEMRLLKECGLSEADIIKGATIYPASWLGVDDRIGSIAPEREASMLILDANPLEDITNLESASFVIHKGLMITR